MTNVPQSRAAGARIDHASLSAKVDEVVGTLNHPAVPRRRTSAETTAPIEGFIRGAVSLVRCPDGLIVPRRFSTAQLKTLDKLGRSHRAEATAGVCIDLVTNGNQVSFDCRVVRDLDRDHPLLRAVMRGVGNIGDPADGMVDGIDLVVVGGNAYTAPAVTGRVDFVFDNPTHATVEVRVYLPYIMSVAVGNLATNGSLEPAPARGYLLVLGDSISQGFVAGSPSLTYPVRVAQTLDLDLLNQAIAGYVFDAATLKGMGRLRKYPPTAIIVAYGTNDWDHKDSAKHISKDADAYLDFLARAFPEVPTYVLSPLWRADEDEPRPCGHDLAWMGEMLSDLCRHHPLMTFVDGYHSIPRNPVMLSDRVLHPGPVAAAIVAGELVSAIDGKRAPSSWEGQRSAPVVTDRQGTDAERPAGPVAAVDAQIKTRPGAPGRQDEFDTLVRIMWRLRQEDGCPWDKVQTHDSIAKDLVEEAYEVADAIDQHDGVHLTEELGDVLEQVALHAQIGADEGSFDMHDVVRGINEKLVRRHPHVFGDLTASDTNEVLDIWDDVKRDEGKEGKRPEGLLDSVPTSLPALMQCEKISKRAARAGFEWESVNEVWKQVASERKEYEQEAPGSKERELEFGDMLFAIVNVARHEGIDAEQALVESNRKFRRRWARVEALAHEQGRDVRDLSTVEQNELWERAKAEEKRA